MKKENIVIFFAFIICAGIIVLSVSKKEKNKELKQVQTNNSPEKNLNSELQKIQKEKEDLYRKINELERENAFLKRAIQGNLPQKHSNNVFDTYIIDDSTTSGGTKPFGVYQNYTSDIKKLISYAKEHKIPVRKREDLKNLIDLCGGTQKVKTINNATGMNIIYFKDGTYIKLLQNLVAIYKECSYHLDFDLEGNATCVGKGTFGYQDCQKLGGTNPTPNNRIPSWIEYKLPKNIFKN